VILSGTFSEKIEIIHNPKKRFFGTEKETLVDKLTEVARNGFGTEITRGDVESHVLSVAMLYIIHNGLELIGFSSYDTFSLECRHILYLHGIAIKEEFQKRGLFCRVNQHAILSKKFDFLAMRTQNPVVYAATQRIVHELYPNSLAIPPGIKRLGKTIAKEYLHMEQFDEKTFVGRMTYGKCLYDKVPRHNRSNVFFDETLRLDYNAGDSVLLIGRLNNENLD